MLVAQPFQHGKPLPQPESRHHACQPAKNFRAASERQRMDGIKAGYLGKSKLLLCVMMQLSTLKLLEVGFASWLDRNPGFNRNSILHITRLPTKSCRWFLVFFFFPNFSVEHYRF